MNLYGPNASLKENECKYYGLVLQIRQPKLQDNSKLLNYLIYITFLDVHRRYTRVCESLQVIAKY